MIRPLTEADIYSLYWMPTVLSALARYRPWFSGLPPSPEQARQRLRLLAGFEPAVEIEAMVLQRSTRSPIGFICLSSIDAVNRKAELSVAFFRGRGTRAALEALNWTLSTVFESLKAHKIIFYVEPTNTHALRLLNALQIDREAVLVGEVVNPAGGRADIWRFALFADQWQTGRGRQALAELVPLAVT